MTVAAGRAALQNEGVQQRFGQLTTTDGSGMTYASIGAGRPLVYVSGWLSHLQLSWELPEERAFYESLAQGCRLVRYDRVGCGLSAPSTRSPSMAYELDQLAAVAATLGPPWSIRTRAVESSI